MNRSESIFHSRTVVETRPRDRRAVWLISMVHRFYGKKYNQEILWADAKGDIAPGLTNAAVHKGKLYVTGLTTPTLMVCSDPAFSS